MVGLDGPDLRTVCKEIPLRLLAVLTALHLAFALPVAAQQVDPNREDIIRLLARMDEFVPVEEEFKSQGFEGENLRLAMEQYRRVFGDREIAEYLADRLISAYAGTLPSAAEAGGLLGPLIDRGITHLPTRDLAYFYRVENVVFNALPVRECGLAVKQRLSDRRLADVTARVAARLNSPALEQYYRIQYDAARLGLTRQMRQLTPEQSARIEAKIGARIFAGNESEESLKLIRIFENPRRATNRAACEAGRTIMSAVLTMEGQDLRDALLFFSTP